MNVTTTTSRTTATAAPPLARTLAAGASRHDWFAACLGTRGTRLTALLADEVALSDLVIRTCARHDTEDRSVGASFLLGHLAWRVTGPLAIAYLEHRRVPAVDPGTVLIGFDEAGEPQPPTFATPAFHALPDDPAADHPDAVVVGEMAELRRALRDTIAGALGGLVAALKPWARRSDRVQWGELSDTVASSLWVAGRELGDEPRGVREAELVLDGTPPFTGTANFVQVTHAGSTCARRVRNTCCLAYRLDDHGYCASCPLEDEQTRGSRWRAALEEEA